MQVDEQVKQAHQVAVDHNKNSYAPYSKLHVSAALVIKGQALPVAGVNVENVSYGATICAERSAVLSAQSQFGDFEVDFIVVISDIDGPAISPCGMCLQVLIEFCPGDTPVYLGDLKGVTQMRRLEEFLPHAFTKAELLTTRP